MNSKSRATHVVTVCATLCSLALGTARAQDLYQGHYLYLGNDPNQLQADWTGECQGLAHDDTHWYINQRDGIWRVPVSVDLNQLGHATPGITFRPLSSLTALVDGGYNHLGDGCVYSFQGTRYYLLPIEGGPPGLAAFHAAFGVDYIDHVVFSPAQAAAPWCAFDATGAVYSSNFDPVSQLNRYVVDWALLAQNTLSLEFAGTVTLRDENGATLTVHSVQGGEFTADGTRLYLVADGIHVFDTSTWRRVQHSNNGSGYFNYEFDPGFPYYQEPEGMTIWDLANTSSPHAGELHVIMLDNDANGDDVYLKHYTRVILVDAANGGAQDGTPAHPFRTVAGALGLAWSGAEVRVRANTYPEPATVSKRVRLTAEGGLVRIGG